MRKIQRAWRKEYRSLILFKEDIEEIVKIAKTNTSRDSSTKAGKDDIVMRIDEFELDNIEELSKIGKAITNELYIAVARASLQLTLGRKSAHLYVADKEDTQLMGMATRIDEILKKRQRTFDFVLKRPFWTGFLPQCRLQSFYFLHGYLIGLLLSYY